MGRRGERDRERMRPPLPMSPNPTWVQGSGCRVQEVRDRWVERKVVTDSSVAPGTVEKSFEVDAGFRMETK